MRSEERLGAHGLTAARARVEGAQRFRHPSPLLAFLPEALPNRTRTRDVLHLPAPLCAGLRPATGEGPPSIPTLTLLPTQGTRAQPTRGSEAAALVSSALPCR